MPSSQMYVGCDSQNFNKKSGAYMSCIQWNLIEKVTLAPKIGGSNREVAMLKRCSKVVNYTCIGNNIMS